MTRFVQVADAEALNRMLDTGVKIVQWQVVQAVPAEDPFVGQDAYIIAEIDGSLSVPKIPLVKRC